VELPERQVSWKRIEDQGYLAIPSFRLGTLESVQSACREFQAAGLDSLVIDVRGNLHGDLEEAVHVADLFADEGKLLVLKSKKSSTTYSADEFVFPFKIYILCDDTTARSAEAFAAALKGRDGVTVVGRKTLGIGTIQKRIELDDGALLNISYAQMSGPDGVDLHGNGVEPDVKVPKTSENKDTDEILQKALEIARENNRGRQAA